jgi:hypothetical protein
MQIVLSDLVNTGSMDHTCKTRHAMNVKRNIAAPLLLHWKSNKYYTTSACICSPRYPACNGHAPYFHLWPAPLYNIFPHYFINGTIFEEKLWNLKCVFRVSLQLLSETFLILRRIEWENIKNVHGSSCKVPVILDRCQ